MLPSISGEFGIVADPELRFSKEGSAWAKIRCKAAARVRGDNGAWADGKPLFIDVMVNGKMAEHLIESVTKGDSILVTGTLEPNEWTDKDGNVRKEMRIKADTVGVGVRWSPVGGKTSTPSVNELKESLGATVVETVPF